MAKKKSKKIIPYRRSFHINIGMIIFFLIFVYMAFNVYTYIRRDKVQFYEVEAGGIVNDRSHTGLILRDEDIIYTDRAGYINYYIREGKRASVGSRVYSLDETGRLSSFLEDNPNTSEKMDENELTDIRNQLSAFCLSYRDIDFSEVVETKYYLQSAVMEYINFNNIEDMDAALESAGISFQQVRASESGIVSYIIDGFSDAAQRPVKKSEKKPDVTTTVESSSIEEETDLPLEEGENAFPPDEAPSEDKEDNETVQTIGGLGEEDSDAQKQQEDMLQNMTLYSDVIASHLTEELFDRSKYIRRMIKSGELIGKGAPAYKIIRSENWSVVFPMSEDDIQEYGDKQTMDVSFKGRDITISGRFSMVTGSDGKPYGKLDFDKYMVQFASERFINFEIQSEEVKGLKIPVSAVTSKDFFLVPVDYISQGGNTSQTGFMKEIYTDKGTNIQFIPTDIYYSTEEYYYINKADSFELKPGDYIVKPGSTDRFQIGPTASLEGVYNINKGYAVFRQIEVLTSNDEYYTIQKGTKYGLSVYDHIMLNAEHVQEGDLIYQ
ncbi:HlyD family efflux transporter periplasmic adaptor subunit [Lachnospiraceae bacterium 62-35]